MISYDPGYWGVACIFRLTGSVFPKAMVWAIPCTILAAVLHHVFHTSTNAVFEALEISDAAATVFGGFNFILGFLVVFRSQQAYSRWWEGGTLLLQLRGEWFNSFSCLIAFCNAAEEKRKEVVRYQQQLVRAYSLLYACALTQVSQMELNTFELINLDGFDKNSLRFLQECPDKCEVVLQWIQRMIVEGEQKTIIKIAPPILSRVYNELGNGIVNLNNARKIKEFPIPFPIAQMVMVMLMFHAMFTPLICAAIIKTTTWAAFLAFVVTFSYWTVLYIALELEMPFGDDPNDLPLREMASDMNKSLVQILKPYAYKVPEFEIEECQVDMYEFNNPTPQYEGHGEPQVLMVDLDGDISEDARSAVLEGIPVKTASRRHSLQGVDGRGMTRNNTQPLTAKATKAGGGSPTGSPKNLRKVANEDAPVLVPSLGSGPSTPQCTTAASPTYEPPPLPREVSPQPPQAQPSRLAPEGNPDIDVGSSQNGQIGAALGDQRSQTGGGLEPPPASGSQPSQDELRPSWANLPTKDPGLPPQDEKSHGPDLNTPVQSSLQTPGT